MSKKILSISSICLVTLMLLTIVSVNIPLTEKAFGQGTITRLNGVYIRDSYSDRFDEQITVDTVTEALDAIFDFAYVAPGITLAGTPGTSVREFGNPITSQALTATTVKRSNNITAVAFYRGSTLLSYDDTPTAGGGTENYTDTDSVGVTSSWSARAADGTSTTTSNSLTVTFVYPIYVGVGAPGLTPAQIQGLTKLVKTQSDTAVTSSPNSEVYYFAAPASYGDLTSILDENSFETISDYTKRTENFTMLDATSQSYYVWEFDNITTQTAFLNTYKY